MISIYSDPPRDISLVIRLRNLFGGFSNLFGWIFFGFGMIFVWVFTLQSDLTGWFHFRGTLEKATGIVTTVSATDMTVNERRVYKYQYQFEDRDGNAHQNYSYSPNHSLWKGDSITIEYPENNPGISRIEGMGRGQLGLLGLMPAIFPIIGLFFIYFGLKRGIRTNFLLKQGYFADGTLIDKQPTNTRINNQTVFKLTFRFAARDGNQYEIHAKTHRPHLLEDQRTEKLIYSNRNPKKAVMFDTINGNLNLGPDGSIEAGSISGLIAVLFVPMLSIIVHGGVAYFLFFS